MGRTELVRPSLHVRYPSAGFLHEQSSSGHIPGIQSELPERVQPSASHVCEINCRRTRAPYAMCSHGELMIEMHVDAQVPLAAGKACAYQAVLKTPHIRNANAAIVQIRSGAALGRE